MQVLSPTSDEAGIDAIQDDLFLISLNLPVSGFDAFIGAWLRKGSPSFLVDPGPSATVPALLRALRHLEAGTLDYILLTHVHLDHAGGAGDMAAAFPMAQIVCHSNALDHLADPGRLWAGTIKTLGDTGRAYGPPRPVAPERLIAAESFTRDAIRGIPTPGHAPHHVSYHTPWILFAGETGGVHIELPDGRNYLRPATPPRFFFEKNLASLDRLIDLAPGWMAHGHLGAVRDGAKWLTRHREQLFLWKKILAAVIRTGDSTEESTALERLLKEDPLLAGFTELAPAVQQRERFFLQNSIRGFAGYLLPNPTDKG